MKRRSFIKKSIIGSIVGSLVGTKIIGSIGQGGKKIHVLVKNISDHPITIHHESFSYSSNRIRIVTHYNFDDLLDPQQWQNAIENNSITTK